MKRFLIVPIVALALVACGEESAKRHADDPAKWIVVQSPVSGLCYEIYAPWNKQLAMVPVDCAHLPHTP